MTRAVTMTKRVPMHDDACAARIVAHVAQLAPGVDVEAACGRYTRGTHKGKLRGWAAVEVCTAGGWKRSEGGSGRVVYPGTVLAVRVEDFNGKSYLEVSA